ncbi:hypothetical protein TNCV_4696231 [Trichonephila clavipes]|nr:hypothetical protein TNCV_4696231 [Trichonephila clavipes]
MSSASRALNSHKSSREVGGRGIEVGGDDNPQGVVLTNWGGTEPNHTVLCVVLKAMANDSRKNLALCRD